MHLSPGTVLDNYAVEAPIGLSSMATVYRVRHQTLGTLHALKVPTVDSEPARQRWLQTARAQRELVHKNIVNIKQVLTWEDGQGLLMEFIKGPTLGQLLASRRLTMEQVDFLVDGVFAGIIAAHQRGFVHGDIKPGNILLAVEGRRLVPKITDFGIVTAHSTAASTKPVQGTIAYLAPEQLTNADEVDERTDVYSLGAVLYELVTGSRPFAGSTPAALLKAIKGQQYTAPAVLVPSLPDRVQRCIAGALRANPNERIVSVEEMAGIWASSNTPPEYGGVWKPGLLDSLQTLAPRSTGAPAPPRINSPAVSWESAIRIPLLVGVLALAIAVVLNTFWPPITGSSPYGLANLHYEDGLRRLRAADFVAAEGQMELAIAANPDALSPHLGLFVSRALQRRDVAAGEALETAGRTAQTSGGPVAELILMLERAWEDDTAVLRERLRQNQGFYLGHLALVTVLAQEDHPEAPRLAEALIDADPQAAIGYVLAVQSCQRHGQWEEAEAKLTKMEQHFPHLAQTIELRALQAYHAGEVGRARDTLVNPGPQTPPSTSIVLSRIEIEYFFGQGQLRRASERHRDCVELSKKQGSDTDLSACNQAWARAEEVLATSTMATGTTNVPPIGYDLFLLAREQLGQAEIALEQGDVALATNHLDELATLWPEADADHPLIERAAELRQQIEGPK